jgi:hypothetical protein
MKRIIFLIIALSTLGVASGCSGPVRHAISDKMQSVNPRRIVIAPVSWQGKAEGDAKDIMRLMRIMAYERLKAMNYSPVDINAVDDAYPDKGGAFFRENAAEVLRRFSSDALLVTSIEDWDKAIVASYASLKVKAGFSLISGDGETLWGAGYSAKDFDIRLDTESMEMAVIKAYEPRMQRIIDTVFTTLPPAPRTGPASGDERQMDRKRYFDWLP